MTTKPSLAKARQGFPHRGSAYRKRSSERAIGKALAKGKRPANNTFSNVLLRMKT